MASSRAAAVGRFDQHLGRGGELLRQRQVELAKSEFLAALKLRPDDPKALGLLGLAYFQLGGFEDALPIYEKLVELNPSDASFWLNLGLVHLKLGRADLAIIELGKSRELDPSQSRTVSYLGLAYARQGSFARAYEAFLQGGEIDLAREMERHLSEVECETIQRRVARRRAETEGVAAEAALEEMELAAQEAERLEVEPEPEAEPEAEPEPEAAELDAEPPGTLEGEGSDEAGATERIAPPPPPPPPPPPLRSPPQGLDLSKLRGDDEAVEEIGDEDIEEVEPAEPAEPPTDGAAEPAAEASEEPAEAASEEPAETASEEPAEAASEEPAEAVRGDGAELEPATSNSWFASGARPIPLPPEGLITQAVHRAEPSQAAQAAALKVAAGHRPPTSLSEFATSQLIRPEDGEHPFELASGGELIVRVSGRVMSRTEDVIVSGGKLGFEPATKRVRGELTDRLFGEGDHKLFAVTGKGFLVASPAGGVFTAVALDDDILYVRENLVYAFEDFLSWENGNVPGSESRIQVVQFRGAGCVALRSKRPLSGVKLASERVVYVEADVLAGWVGRVVPRLVSPSTAGTSSASFVECSGEGVVLIEDPGAEPVPRPDG